MHVCLSLGCQFNVYADSVSTEDYFFDEKSMKNIHFVLKRQMEKKPYSFSIYTSKNYADYNFPKEPTQQGQQVLPIPIVLYRTKKDIPQREELNKVISPDFSDINIQTLKEKVKFFHVVTYKTTYKIGKTFLQIF